MIKQFKSYKTNSNISSQHIREFILRDNGISQSIYARFGISKDELIADCWEKIWKNSNTERLDYIAHQKAYSGILISDHLNDRIIRKTTSVAVKWFLIEIYNSEKKKIKVKLKNKLEIEESVRNMLNNSSNESYAQKSVTLVKELNLTDEETVLFNWQIELIDEDEAAEILNVCRATLFNRWNKLKPKLQKAYYRPRQEEQYSDAE